VIRYDPDRPVNRPANELTFRAIVNIAGYSLAIRFSSRVLDRYLCSLLRAKRVNADSYSYLSVSSLPPIADFQRRASAPRRARTKLCEWLSKGEGKRKKKTRLISAFVAPVRREGTRALS